MKHKKLILSVTVLLLSSVLLRIGYDVSLNHNNQIESSIAYTREYPIMDSTHSCIDIARGNDAKYPVGEAERCRKEVVFHYGFPFSYEHIDFKGHRTFSRTIFVIDYVIIMLAFLLILPVFLLLIRYVTQRKHANTRH